jgi:hypothetical protein
MFSSSDRVFSVLFIKILHVNLKWSSHLQLFSPIKSSMFFVLLSSLWLPKCIAKTDQLVEDCTWLAGKDPSLFGCLNIWDTNHSLQTRLVWEFLHIIFIWDSNHSLQTRLHFVWLGYDSTYACFSSFWLLASLRWREHLVCDEGNTLSGYCIYFLNLRILAHEITLWNSCICFQQVIEPTNSCTWNYTLEFFQVLTIHVF